jgi:glycerophosphoryl diester phosphodiesterase
MVWVIGHRGARQLAVENSLASLQIALDQGADGVECDVQLSADGEPLLWHDADLQRLCGDARRLDQLKWRELRELRPSVASLQPQPVAHLDDVVEWAQARPLRLNIELKVAGHAAARRLVEVLLRRIGEYPPELWVFSSFSREALAWLRNLAPAWRRGTLVENELDLQLVGDPGEIEQLHPCGDLLGVERLQQWQERGWPVWPWTLNHPAAWERAVQLAGPQAIAALITDDPGGLRRFVDNNGLARAQRSTPAAEP